MLPHSAVNVNNDELETRIRIGLIGRKCAFNNELRDSRVKLVLSCSQGMA